MIDDLQRLLDQACAAYRRSTMAGGLRGLERRRAAVHVLEVADLLGRELLEQAGWVGEDPDEPIPFRLVDEDEREDALRRCEERVASFSQSEAE